MKKKKLPMRKCIITNKMYLKRDLLRIVKNKDGEILVDSTGKASGRGAYVIADFEIIRKAQEMKFLEKFYEENEEKIKPIYDEIIRLIYRKSIPKK